MPELKLTMASTSSPNTLGLDFDQLNIQATTEPITVTPPSPKEELQSDATSTDTRDKKKPYINPERVKTGGNQRDKLSEEALTERMARMREQNEKIKQRRMDVKADEDAFKKTQESERVKLAQIRKVQETVDRTREQNAKRKMDKIQSREWDSGKPTVDWKRQAKKSQPLASSASEPVDTNKPAAQTLQTDSPVHGLDGWTRGGSPGPRGSHRGRGRGRGSTPSTGSADLAKPATSPDASSQNPTVPSTETAP